MAVSTGASWTGVRADPSRRRLSRGITLLEVLIGLLVLAVALLALTRTAAIEIDQFAALRERTLATWLAQDILVETRLGSALPPTGSSSGTRRFGARDWYWQVRVLGTDVPTIRRIEVRIADGVEHDSVLAQLDGFAGQDLLP